LLNYSLNGIPLNNKRYLYKYFISGSSNIYNNITITIKKAMITIIILVVIYIFYYF